MRLRYLATAAAALTLSLSAHADSYTNFSLDGTLSSGSTFSGTLKLDETIGVFTGGNLTVTAPDSLSVNAVQQEINYPVNGDITVNIGTGTAYDTPIFVLVLAENSLIGYDGGSIGSLSDPANGYTSNLFFGGSDFDDVTSGTLTAATTAATPEPSSLALLGTGVLGVIGAARRRFAA